MTCDQLKTWLVSRESRVSHATLVRSVTSEEAIACGQGLLETHLDAFIEDNHREEWHAELQEGLGPDAVRIAYRPPGRPVMAPPDNLQRAAWADKAVQAFLAETACDAQNCLRDLLCDLMHWAAVSGFDFASELERAQYHYDAEVGR